MEYERKNLCCDDGFLIIFCHDRYYKVHFCFYQIIINIRVIVCSSNHLSDARYNINITVSGYITSRCRSGTPNEVPIISVIPRLWFTNYAQKAPPYLTGAFLLARKTTAYNLKDSCLILHWKIQHEYLKKNFSYSGVKAWNSLQTTIKAEPSLWVLRNLCAVSVSRAPLILVVYLPTLIPVYPSIKLSVRQSVRQSTYPSVVPVRPSVRPSIYLYLYLFDYLCVCLRLYLSRYLSLR